MALSDNGLHGAIPPGWNASSNLGAEFNCLDDWNGHSRFCPSDDLAAGLATLLLGSFLVASAVVFAHQWICPLAPYSPEPSGPWWALPCALRSLRLTMRDLNLAARSPCSVDNLPWMVVVAVTLGWSLFSLTPEFQGTVIQPALSAVLRSDPDLPTPAVRALLRSVLPTCAPGVLLLLWLVLRELTGLASRAWACRYPGSSAAAHLACSWTLLASRDCLAENLSSVRDDQLMLLGLLFAITLTAGLLNYFALPVTASVWVVVATPRATSYMPELPVSLELSIPVSRGLVAACTASMGIVLYHTIICLTLPREIWTSSAVAATTGSAARERAREEKEPAAPLVRALAWLRQAYKLLAASVTLLAACCTATYWGIASDNAAVDADSFDYYKDWVPYVDGGREPIRINSLNYVPAAVVAAALVTQVALVVVWNLTTWKQVSLAAYLEARPGDALLASQPETGDGSQAPTIVGEYRSFQATAMRAARGMSYSQGQRAFLLCVLGLHMIPALSASKLLGQALIGIVWGLTFLFLAAAASVRDTPQSFEALRSSPVLGMVLLASDLEAALASDLEASVTTTAHEGAGAVEEAPRCRCAEPEMDAGCPFCQSLIRRAPATLFRMSRTLAISYRWQPVCQAIIRPPGRSGHCLHAGLKGGVAGLNMSRWQREQLLLEIRRGRHNYVWLDALSIPAAALGRSPRPGTWIAGVSNTLLTRMMAVYATAADTLVLRSNEVEGNRYHERAWTAQEFCGSRRIIIRCEGTNMTCKGPPACSVGMVEVEISANSCTRKEAVDFDGLRVAVMLKMRSALPLWAKSLVTSLYMPPSGDEAAGLVNAIRLYASTVDRVGAVIEADKVRALLPMLLNTPVQGAAELRELVLHAKSVVAEYAPDDPSLFKAMQEAWRLLNCE